MANIGEPIEVIEIKPAQIPVPSTMPALPQPAHVEPPLVPVETRR